MDRKQLKEIEIFRSFASVVNLPIIMASIESRIPPEPDIRCEIEGKGIVGFELTELLDQSLMARLGLSHNTNAFLKKYLEHTLSENNRRFFIEKFRNYHLKFEFSDRSTQMERNRVIPSVFGKLMMLPDGFEGKAVKFDDEVFPILNYVYIRKIKSVGPVFVVGSFGWLSNPNTNAISQKFSKKYECSYPVELLIYIDTDLIQKNSDWLLYLEKYVNISHESPRIGRVWLYNNFSKTIECMS